MKHVLSVPRSWREEDCGYRSCCSSRAASARGASYYFLGTRTATAATNTVTSTSVSTTTISGGNSSRLNGSSAVSINAVQIYKDSNESVVTVDGLTTTTVSSFFGSETVQEEVLGSGFIMNYGNSNYVVTNFHVVDGVTNMTVIFWNSDAYPASVVRHRPV